MKKNLPVVIEKPWKIPKGLITKSGRMRLKDMLISINQINEETSYYIRDSYEGKIIVDSPTSPILCGYSQELADKEGFSFYRHVLSKKEWDWIMKAHEVGHNIFYKYPPAKRKYVIFRYDFEVKTKNQGKLTVHHKAVPYQLCGNGNLWLSLCSVSLSNKHQSGNATITNTETGEHYIFKNGQFVLSAQLAITPEDLTFLELLCNELSNEQIISQMKISERNFWRKRQRLFEKLNVHSSVGAVHKAHLMGII